MLDIGYPYFIIALFGLIVLGIILIIYILIPYIISVLDKEVPDDYFDGERDNDIKEMN